MKYREFILWKDRSTSLTFSFSPNTWGLGGHWYYNLWLTFYFYVGPFWVSLTCYWFKGKFK